MLNAKFGFSVTSYSQFLKVKYDLWKVHSVSRILQRSTSFSPLRCVALCIFYFPIILVAKQLSGRWVLISDSWILQQHFSSPIMYHQRPNRYVTELVLSKDYVPIYPVYITTSNPVLVFCPGKFIIKSIRSNDYADC